MYIYIDIYICISSLIKPIYEKAYGAESEDMVVYIFLLCSGRHSAQAEQFVEHCEPICVETACQAARRATHPHAPRSQALVCGFHSLRWACPQTLSQCQLVIISQQCFGLVGHVRMVSACHPHGLRIASVHVRFPWRARWQDVGVTVLMGSFCFLVIRGQPALKV